MKISNWGNYPKVEAQVRTFSSVSGLRESLGEVTDVISRGLGRSYGDSSLWKNISSTLDFNKILAFDEEAGTIYCQAGASLRDILKLILPKGWFLPVTPGTRDITVGGAISSDVHGKNHHVEGSFCDYVESLDVILGSGNIEACSERENSDLFHAVCGGMGLMGIIVSAKFRLKKIETALIRRETIRTECLEELLGLMEKSAGCLYSAAWLDCMNPGKRGERGILILGEHALKTDICPDVLMEQPASSEKAALGVPFEFPSFTLNRLTAKAFNACYWHRHLHTPKDSIVGINSFFYPLDSIRRWNRLYGRRGMLQYQFVLPKSEGRKGLSRVLRAMKQAGAYPFLAVLKLMGKGNRNLLSFPMEGVTLALDFRVTSGIFRALEEMDRTVLDSGGRVYLAKDARMGEHMFKKSYENSARFIDMKCRFDPLNKFRSFQSMRLGI